MKKKAEQPRQLMLPLAGAALNCFMVSDEELEGSLSDKTPELLKKAVAGRLSPQTLSRHREALLQEAVKTDDINALPLLVPRGRRLDPERFQALFQLASETRSPDAAAWLLQYRQAHYTSADFDSLEQRQLDRELGLLEPDMEELRKTFRLRYRAEGVCVCGVRREQRSYSIPARIGGKAVIGVDAASFYELDPMPRVTRHFSEDTAAAPGVADDGTFYLGCCPERKGQAESPLRWRVIAREGGR
ncbi:MAG: hypothetical protein J6X24_02415, partial [Firmicutes bacterium]|nr:hypothetical protein [Bacillota bacterium]